MADRMIPVAKIGELEDGEMKQVSADGVEVLLSRIDGKYHAVSAHCTHYGAPLADGALCGEYVVCPWHHACFNVTTGDLQEPPALDALVRYEVHTENDEVFVRLPPPEDVSDRRTPEMTERDTEDARTFVILGGGAAGYTAAQTLREDGFTGRVVMLTREERLPYDRPNLSKDYLQGEAEPEWMPLRPDEFYDEYGIEVQRGKEVERVDSAVKRVVFRDGESLEYDSLLVATGGQPRHLDLPNADLENIFVLRSFDRAEEIIAAAENSKRAVVVGASFIGMETAGSLAKRGLDVTVVAPDSVPFAKTLGEEVGRFFQKLHEENGVRFQLGASVQGFEGEGKVGKVLLESGEHIPADLVIVGIGVVPVTGFFVDAPLEKDDGVVVDEFLRVSEGLYAAGDIAHLPDFRTGKLVRIEHWRYAMQQGRAAARNMAGKPTKFDGVPFFWTQQFGVSLRYIGHVNDWDEIILQGDLQEQKFLAFYVKGNRVLAVAGVGRDHEMAQLHMMMQRDRMPAPDELRAEDYEVAG